MLQVYVRTADVINQEWPPFLTEKHWLKEHIAHYNDIKERGIIKALCVNPSGTIQYGHGRWLIARNLGIEYLPVNLAWLLGLRLFDNGLAIRDSIESFFRRPVNSNQATLPINLYAHEYRPNYHETLGKVNYYRLELIDSLTAEPDWNKSNIETIEILRRNKYGL